ncbi:hypothetical protein [Synergistes jonesii]|uniref:Uncharacterized protein n=1 Tax=Synergistes jonesii TaxID=2754 RepID=A0A073ISM9_9BACT|nr:hypothetical protein [Synergistes jonesii]KEJ93358.1 hypothetical protein EH55_08640 [Synergistes jonesii]OFB65112.1 hypothetical protein JS73_01145 [Synergistes jonesii]OFB65941.1 hypothetical protein JS72_00345 [Synergistes jonesii]OFB66385.1 hypothetical protein JS79_01155 [Synergistes jonesii]OFB69100.1 hypothetical protein JS78_01155 [Synergistes jonesii]
MELHTGDPIFEETSKKLGVGLKIQPFFVDGVCSYLAAFLTRNDNKNTPFKETDGFKKIAALLYQYDFEQGQRGTESRGPYENYIFKRHENIPIIKVKQSKDKFVVEDFKRDYDHMLAENSKTKG